MSTPSKVIAFVFALTAFAVAIVAGMAGGDAAESVLARALVVLFVCHLIGLALGSTVNHVLNEYLRKYEADHPVPDVPSGPGPTGAGTGGSGGDSV
ncbi:MAG: hypothetical protein IT436_07350 [Phycisphaerales bacterium]|nr:hypothetical protein [Phycisphaerales bacterium]